jgi:CDP-diacylglycerol---glycerol-3-phosphate 3-phosphatidyltransferase
MLSGVGLPNQLTVARIAALPVVLVLFAWSFHGHNYAATIVFAVAMCTDFFDGRLARRSGRTSALGSLLDPVADKVLVLSVLIVLVEKQLFPGWLVALIVAREFLVSGLRLAALERGVVIQARDLGKLKTWSQAIAAGLGGLELAGAWHTEIAIWAAGVALALTWLSGLDYARSAPAMLRTRATAS